MTVAKTRRRVRNEPVALAGVIRTLLYGLLGTRLNARSLAELVFVAETVVGLGVRHLVSPTARSTRRPRRSPAGTRAARPALRAA